MSSLLDGALKLAITFVIIALLIRWGYALLRPFLPLLVVAGLGFIIVRYVIARPRRW